MLDNGRAISFLSIDKFNMIVVFSSEQNTPKINQKAQSSRTFICSTKPTSFNISITVTIKKNYIGRQKNQPPSHHPMDTDSLAEPLILKEEEFFCTTIQLLLASSPSKISTSCGCVSFCFAKFDKQPNRMKAISPQT